MRNGRIMQHFSKVVEVGRRWWTKHQSGANRDVYLVAELGESDLALYITNGYTLTGVQATGKPLSFGGSWRRDVGKRSRWINLCNID
jgi:hypothetical protein